MRRTVNTHFFHGIYLPSYTTKKVFALPFVSQALGYEREDSLRRKILGRWFPMLQKECWVVTDPVEVDQIKSIILEKHPTLWWKPSTKKLVLLTLKGCEIVASLAYGGNRFTIDDSLYTPNMESEEFPEFEQEEPPEPIREEVSISSLFDLVQNLSFPSTQNVQLLTVMSMGASEVERAFIWMMVFRNLGVKPEVAKKLLHHFGYNEDLTEVDLEQKSGPSVKVDSFVQNLVGRNYSFKP